ncbi:MAG: hypothetical protein QE271_14390 [Bacteriovoracaceae bacterium]|nr:hypothetical protein [Bacteriovoracaceae bacterium]
MDTIYGLKIENQINHNYFHLSQEFQKQRTEFLLLDLETLMAQVSKHEMSWVIVCTTNLEESRIFERKIKQQLKIYINQEKLCLFQFSSFTPSSNLELQNFKSNYYINIPLPLKTSEAVEIMIKHMEKLTHDGNQIKNFSKFHQF